MVELLQLAIEATLTFEIDATARLGDDLLAGNEHTELPALDAPRALLGLHGQKNGMPREVDGAALSQLEDTVVDAGEARTGSGTRRLGVRGARKRAGEECDQGSDDEGRTHDPMNPVGSRLLDQRHVKRKLAVAGAPFGLTTSIRSR